MQFELIIVMLPGTQIRKNVATLTALEKHHLKSSLKEALASTIPWSNYKDNANLHGKPGDIICPNRPFGICCPHHCHYVPVRVLLVDRGIG